MCTSLRFNNIKSPCNKREERHTLCQAHCIHSKNYRYQIDITNKLRYDENVDIFHSGGDWFHKMRG